MTKTQQELGVDLPKLKRWLKRNVGEMCHDYCWSCIVCRSWRIYEDLEGFLTEIDILNKYEAIPPPKSEH